MLATKSRYFSIRNPLAKIQKAYCSSASSSAAGRSKLLFYLSYNGSPYNGVASYSSDWKIRSVSKVLHQHLIRLMGPSRWISRINVSSRTDKSVHALMNTISVLHSGPVDYSPALLRLLLNASLLQSGESVRIHLIRPVPLSSAEFSLITGIVRREYVYRLALLAQPGLALMHPEAAWLNGSRWLVDPVLSKDLLRQAAELLSGEHDFTAFTNLQGLNGNYSPFRRMDIRLDESVPADPLHKCNSFTDDCITAYIDLHFGARSFLYKQVRFLTGAMVATARGTLSMDQLRDMLENPADYTGVKPYDAAPQHGLYLKSVEYADPKWNLTWPDILADNATLNGDFCRGLLLRFRDKTCPMDIVQLSREHEDYLETVAKSTNTTEENRSRMGSE